MSEWHYQDKEQCNRQVSYYYTLFTIARGTSPSLTKEPELALVLSPSDSGILGMVDNEEDTRSTTHRHHSSTVDTDSLSCSASELGCGRVVQDITSSVMDASPEIAAEEEKVRRRRSTVAGCRRSFASVGGRLSLAGPPAPCLEDQILRLDENQPWDTNLNLLLDIALREAARRLETRLSGDECVSELRADVVKQSGALANQISELVSGLMPSVTDANGHYSSGTR
ncbi:hypothetical protein E2C01_019774 [Portunus trituberculatus]|uniref:Uncharacterized protein n=1 Tax=Portunus trituberculatus TaxID=210409 RepID=A0A5B7DZS8_PORTR|nr:hypothetical protein [Portunus trituberculatus]